MRKTFFFGLMAAALFLSACKNEKSSTNTAAGTPSVSAPAQGFYKHFKGTIDSFPITMDLVQTNDWGEDRLFDDYKGYYYYDKYQEPISLYGGVDSTGALVLQEVNRADKYIVFVGKLDANGHFSGVWRDSSTKRELRFSLKETASEGMAALDVVNFEDSFRLWPNRTQSPTAYFDLQTLVPSKNTEGSLADFLKGRMLSDLLDDTTGTAFANTPWDAAAKMRRDTFFDMYKLSMKEMAPDSNSTEVSMSSNYDESHSTSVLFNERGLLSLGYGLYEYGGGVHGNHGTKLVTYDLKQKKALKLTDVFLPKFEKTLNAALVKAVRKAFNMKPKEALSEYLFDASLTHNDNFCITEKGVLFLYNPYEIAAYAYGEIELFIPFSEIKSVVNPVYMR